MIDFGYSITKSNRLDLDTADTSVSQEIASQERSLLQCIGCGTCTGGCTAGQFTPHNPRRMQLLLRYGQTEGLEEQLNRCMVCGKCQMLCPRGVDLRSIWVKLARALETSTK